MHDVALYAALLTSVGGALASAITAFLATRTYNKLSHKIATKGGHVREGADVEDFGTTSSKQHEERR